MALHIITDSAADLPPEIIKEFNLEVIPFKVYLDEVEYNDNIDITPKEVFDKMRAGAKARTAQVTTHEFVKAFEKYAKNGDSLIYIGFSSGLSGTFNAAHIAKQTILEEYPDFDFTTIDSKCASMGFGLVVYYALVMLKNGASKEEIIEAAKFNLEHMEHIFTVDDLDYLYRGGRLSRTSALVGGLLGIKPVLEVSDEGKLVPVTKVKGRQNAIKKVVDFICERGVNLDKQVIGISHGDDLEAVKTIQELLKEKAGCEKFIVSFVGCTIGAHSGPGTLAVFALDCESNLLNL